MNFQDNFEIVNKKDPSKKYDDLIGIDDILNIQDIQNMVATYNFSDDPNHDTNPLIGKEKP